MVTWIACAFGVIVIAVGVRWIVKRSVEVGIEGWAAPTFILRGGMAVLFGVLAILIGVYILASRGDAFKLVEQTLMNSQALQSQVGHVERVRLVPFGSYDEKTAGDHGWATMTVEVTGTTKTVILDVRAKKASGAWEVEQASIDGKPLVLKIQDTH